MQPLVFANVQISYPEFQRFNQQFALRTRWYRLLLLPVIIGVVLWNSSAEPATAATIALKLGATAVVSALATAYMVFNFNRRLRHQYAGSKLLQAAATYTLTEAGISVESLIWRGSAGWAALRGFRKLNGWYYLMAAKGGSGFLLDPRCLLAPATEQDVVALFWRSGLRQL